MQKSKLVNVLIAKSILETILVGTIAVVVYMKAFPPTFHGWGEAVTESQTIAGWVVNDADPWRRVEVQLFIDGKFVGTQVAHLSRPDVLRPDGPKMNGTVTAFRSPRSDSRHA